MVPAAAVASDEGDADFDEAATEEQALAEIVAAIKIADRVWFFVEIEGFLGLLGSDQAQSLLVIAVEGDGRVVGGFVGEALEAVEGLAKLLARLCAAGGNLRGQEDIAD